MAAASATDFDAEWEKWGRVDPYFGVLTAEDYRRENLTEESRKAFFRTGELHVDRVMARASRAIGRQFTPDSILDFGCGVGRLVVPFSRCAKRVVGVDVAESMLAEARSNCESLGAGNVELRRVEDSLANVPEQFDLVHSFIVLQHIEPSRGLPIIQLLLTKIRPGGCAAIHVTYGRRNVPHLYGAPITAPTPVARKSLRRRVSAAKAVLMGALESRSDVSPPTAAPEGDPEMPMFTYDLGKVAFMFQAAGLTRIDMEMIDHAGELGVLMFGAAHHDQ